MKTVLIKPIVSEKTNALQEQVQQYVFQVARNANKLEIKDAIETMYSVSVCSVNTMVMPSKDKTKFTKAGIIEGRKSSFKKAVVTLKDGDFIDFYENI